MPCTTPTTAPDMLALVAVRAEAFACGGDEWHRVVQIVRLGVVR